MLVTLLIPVTSLLLGHLILGEVIEPREIAGALVIASSLLVLDGRVLAFFGKRNRTRFDGPHAIRVTDKQRDR